MSSITAGKVSVKKNSVFAQVLEFTGIARYLRRKRTENDLMRMSDRQLRDIGLNRYEVRNLVKQIT